MAFRYADTNCIICKTNINGESAVYAINVGLTHTSTTAAKEKYLLNFNNKRLPKGLIHTSCWQEIFASHEDKKEIKPIHPRNRLKSVQSEE